MPDSFSEMEPLFLAVICGCNAGLFREVLQEVYIPRIQRKNISFAANVLGARGPLLSVLAHFFEHGDWGSSLKTGVEEQSLSAEEQLFVLMQAALYLTATRGLGSPDARTCYERAESLCRSVNRPSVLYSILIGQWRHSLNTDTLTATMQIAERIYALSRRQNDSALTIRAYNALAVSLYYSGDFESAQQYAKRGAQIWRMGGVQTSLEEVHTPALACMYIVALSEWHFGEVASSQAAITEAISLAKKLNDMHGLAAALWNAAMLWLL